MREMMDDDIKRELAQQVAEAYARTIEDGLRRLIQEKTGLTAPASDDKEALKAFVDGNGLSIIATPPTLPALFVLAQHGKEIGRFSIAGNSRDAVILDGPPPKEAQ
jgi:hypothetical protein